MSPVDSVGERRRGGVTVKWEGRGLQKSRAELRVECQRARSRYQTLVDDHGSPASARSTGVRVRLRTPGLHLP